MIFRSFRDDCFRGPNPTRSFATPTAYEDDVDNVLKEREKAAKQRAPRQLGDGAYFRANGRTSRMPRQRMGFWSAACILVGDFPYFLGRKFGPRPLVGDQFVIVIFLSSHLTMCLFTTSRSIARGTGAAVLLGRLVLVGCGRGSDPGSQTPAPPAGGTTGMPGLGGAPGQGMPPTGGAAAGSSTIEGQGRPTSTADPFATGNKPQSNMPKFGSDKISDENLKALAEYLASLK